jgi:hypothetical protein
MIYGNHLTLQHPHVAVGSLASSIGIKKIHMIATLAEKLDDAIGDMTTKFGFRASTDPT